MLIDIDHATEELLGTVPNTNKTTEAECENRMVSMYASAEGIMMQ